MVIIFLKSSLRMWEFGDWSIFHIKNIIEIVQRNDSFSCDAIFCNQKSVHKNKIPESKLAKPYKNQLNIHQWSKWPISRQTKWHMTIGKIFYYSIHILFLNSCNSFKCTLDWFLCLYNLTPLSLHRECLLGSSSVPSFFVIEIFFLLIDMGQSRCLECKTSLHSLSYPCYTINSNLCSKRNLFFNQ